jgi:hypothetical protein
MFRPITLHMYLKRGPGSSVGIATGYGLDGPEIESRWGRDFSHTSRPALGPTQLPVQWIPGLSREQNGWGVVLTAHPLLAPRSRMSRAIPLHPSGPLGPVIGRTLSLTYTLIDPDVLCTGIVYSVYISPTPHA